MAITRDDCCRVNFGFNELVCTAEKFSSNNNNRSCSITDFLVLFLREVNKNLAGRVFHLQKRQNGSAIVRNGDFLQRVQNVGKGTRVSFVTYSDVVYKHFV